MKKRAKWKGRTPDPVIIERVPSWFEESTWSVMIVAGVLIFIAALVIGGVILR